MNAPASRFLAQEPAEHQPRRASPRRIQIMPAHHLEQVRGRRPRTSRPMRPHVQLLAQGPCPSGAPQPHPEATGCVPPAPPGPDRAARVMGGGPRSVPGLAAIRPKRPAVGPRTRCSPGLRLVTEKPTGRGIRRSHRDRQRADKDAQRRCAVDRYRNGSDVSSAKWATRRQLAGQPGVGVAGRGKRGRGHPEIT